MGRDEVSSPERLSVGIVVERRSGVGPWRPEQWRVVDVLIGAPAAQPGTFLGKGEGGELYYAGAADIELFPGEASAYRNNLTGSRPAIYVVLRHQDAAPGVMVHVATVDPGEIEAHADAGDDLIEAFPLPAAVAAWMEGFVERHHVERPFHKRQRDRANLEALARQRRVPVAETSDD